MYANAPLARLTLPNGSSFGGAIAIPGFGDVAAFFDVPFMTGTLLAEALASDGATVLANHSRSSWGAPAAVVLSVDAPSPRTGTGGAVYLDGTDVALLRATIVDAAGNVVPDADVAVAFSVTEGPMHIVGTHNGDPTLQQAAATPSVPAYGGFARAVARVSLLAVGADSSRALLAAVNVDAGRGNLSSAVLPPATAPPTQATIQATAPGLTAGTVTLALSVDSNDAPLAVASQNVYSADVGE